MTDAKKKLFDLAANAESMSPKAFFDEGLQLTSELTGIKHLAFWLASARYGMHCAFRHNLENSVIKGLEDDWDSSPVTIPALQYLGSYANITDLMPAQAILQNEYLMKRREDHGLFMRGIILMTGIAPGIIDTLTIFDETFEPLPPETVGLVQESFQVLRIGFDATIKQQLRTQHQAEPAVPACIVDRHGYVYGPYSGFLDQMKELNPDMVQGGTNQLFDPPALAMQSTAVSVLNFEEIASDLYLVKLPMRAPHEKEQLFNDSLTSREQQIVRLIAKGLSYKQIATELEVAVSTIANTVTRIKKKLEIGNRAEFVALIDQIES